MTTEKTVFQKIEQPQLASAMGSGSLDVLATPAVVALAGVFAYFVPDAFGWVRGNAQTSLLGLIMLTMGLTLTGEDFRALAFCAFAGG